MRAIIRTGLILALALPGAAAAQQPETAPGRPGVDSRPGPAGRAALLEANPAAPGAPPAGAPAGPQKPPRPEKAIGPDLMAYVFAPIGTVVVPITEGLHAFDAAIAPVNAALLPVTGPLDPALLQPADAPPPAAAPAKAPVGPRK